ncbi:MAG: DUF222 domain-containing protein [Actinomycetia bacterium]|nr:DUF222 domain-containing protein [Actinomycetes bacterium]
MIVTVEELDEQTKVAQGLVALGHKLSRGHYDLCVGSVQFADGAVWVAQGSASAAHWLAERLDVTASTVREWIRIGRALGAFRPSADAFANGRLSYAKIQVLTRYLTINNEPQLLALAEKVAAGSLPEAIDAELMRVNLKREPDGDWPTIAQQRHDALTRIIGGTGGTDGGNVDYEVIFHVRGDGCTLNDGTPITQSAIARLLDTAFVRLLIHNAEHKPVNASTRQRHPNGQQKRLVEERDRHCTDCGRKELLTYDHNPAWETTHHTHTDELELRCAPCHRTRHSAPRVTATE